jgi:hypothetical protein
MAFIRRAAPDAKRIQARVEKFMQQDSPAVDPHVALLAAGFFGLERMRTGRAAVKRKLK